MSRRPGAGDAEQPVPPRPPIAIKGRAEGLRITVDRGEPADLEAALRSQLLGSGGRFFARSPVTLQMPPGPLDLELAARLGRVVEAAGLELVAVVNAGAGAGGVRSPAEAAAAPPAPPEGALVVPRTLRSGQRVLHAGSVLVLGDVNAGAEVIAGEHVVVWGRLRGRVEAGQARPEDPELGACVCALDLAPTQLRIGPAVARAPEEADRVPAPEVARLREGRIVVDPWLA